MFCFSRKSPNVSVLGIAVKNKYNPLKFRRDLPKHFRLYIGYDTCAFCCRPIKFPSLCKGNRQGRIKPTWGPGWLWILWRTFLHILLQNYAIKVIVNLFIWHPPMAFGSVGESSMWQYKYKSWYWLTDPSKHALSGAILYLKYKKFYFALNIVAPWLQPSQLPPPPPPFNPPGNRCVSPIQPWTTSIHVVRRIYRSVRTWLEIFAPFWYAFSPKLA